MTAVLFIGILCEAKSNKLENPNKLDWKKKCRQEHLEKKMNEIGIRGQGYWAYL